MSLCKVVAIFDEFRLGNVEHKLIKHGVHGFTLHPVRGPGRYFDGFNENHLIKHIQMEIYAANEQANDLCRLISEVAYSGSESEGLVSVVPVQTLYWIHDKREARVNDFLFRSLAMKINAIKLATATAAYVAGIWVLCSVAVAIAPNALRYISGAMMHLDHSQWDWEMGMDTFVVGLLAWSFFSWVTVWCIVTLYQYLLGGASHE